MVRGSLGFHSAIDFPYLFDDLIFFFRVIYPCCMVNFGFILFLILYLFTFHHLVFGFSDLFCPVTFCLIFLVAFSIS